MSREELLEEFRVTMKIIQRCMEQEHYATVEIICRDVLRTIAKEESADLAKVGEVGVWGEK